MMPTPSPGSTIDQQTPTLRAIDPRGLPARTVSYLRTAPGEVAAARVEVIAHDAAGRAVAQSDPRLAAPFLRTQYQLSGFPIRIASADAGTRWCLVGAAGQVRALWDSRGTVHTTAYDARGRPIAVMERHAGQPEHCRERMAYAGPEARESNACGHLARHDDPAGTLVTEAYDLRGAASIQVRRFLRDMQEPDWPTDIVGREPLLEDTRYTTTVRQDAAGAPIVQIDAKGNVRRFRYAVDGALVNMTMILSSGTIIEPVSSIVYDASGHMVGQTAGNGVVMTATYDEPTGRRLTCRTTRGNRDVLQDLRYEYDAGGRLTLHDDRATPVRFWRNRRSDGVRRYGYDSLSRLVEASGCEHPLSCIGPALPGVGPIGDNTLTPYTQRFHYDSGNNLTALQHHGNASYTRHMTVDTTSNRALPWATNEPEPDLGTGFDANGNAMSLERGQALRWNGRNQLIGVTPVERAEQIDDTEQYTYAGDGARQRKLTTRLSARAEHTADVRYLPGLELRTDSATGEKRADIVAGAGAGSVRVMCWEAGRPVDLPDEHVRYRIDDHLGSMSMELDAGGLILAQEGYYPFGGTAWRASRNSVEARCVIARYSGKERDATGLYYYGFRYYAPWLQRWINPDPAGTIGGPNTYVFVGNRPVDRHDAIGLWDNETLVGAVVALMVVVGLAIGAYLLQASNVAIPPVTDAGAEERRKDWTRRITRLMRDLTAFGILDTYASEVQGFARSHSMLEYRVMRDRSRFLVLALDRTTAADFDAIDSSRRSRQLKALAGRDGVQQLVLGEMDDNTTAATQHDANPSPTALSPPSFELDQQTRASSNRTTRNLPPPETSAATAPPAAGAAAAAVGETGDIEVTHEPAFTKQLAMFMPDGEPVEVGYLAKPAKKLAELLASIASGERPGKLVKPIGAWSADVTGFGSGRGAQRLIYTAHGNKVTIHGIGDYHGSRGGIKTIQWWR